MIEASQAYHCLSASTFACTFACKFIKGSPTQLFTWLPFITFGRWLRAGDVGLQHVTFSFERTSVDFENGFISNSN
jgi:hypothetical protein